MSYGDIQLGQYWFGNGLMPVGPKPLAEQMLTYHRRWGPVTMTWGQFHKRYLSNIIEISLKNYFFEIPFKSLRGQWVHIAVIILDMGSANESRCNALSQWLSPYPEWSLMMHCKVRTVTNRITPIAWHRNDCYPLAMKIFTNRTTNTTAIS